MIKKGFSAVTAILMAATLTLAGCGGSKAPENAPVTEASQETGTQEKETPQAEESQTTEKEAEEAQEDKTYGKLTISGATGNPDQYMVDAAAMVTGEHPEIEVEYPPCDTNTREQVIKTAIAAGDPPTLGYYWGTRVNSFYDNGMCLDLADLIDPELLAGINEQMLAPCKGDNGEIYAIPVKCVYHTCYYNTEIFDRYGFEEPRTWDEMTEIFQKLKEDDIFGFSTNSASMQDCLYGITYGELDAKVGPGTAYGVANGDVSVAPGTDAGNVIADCIKQVQEWYEAGYWYPGDGGINCSPDDANAAFAQGRCAVIFNFSGSLGTLVPSCDFEIGTFLKPTSDASIESEENTEPDVFFIPSNASPEQINTGVAFLEAILSQEIQQAVVGGNQIPSMTTYEYTDMSPILEEVIDIFNTSRIEAGLNPTRTSSEMQTFIKQQIFAAPCSGQMTIDQTLEEMERIRLAAGGQ